MSESLEGQVGTNTPENYNFYLGLGVESNAEVVAGSWLCQQNDHVLSSWDSFLLGSATNRVWCVLLCRSCGNAFWHALILCDNLMINSRLVWLIAQFLWRLALRNCYVCAQSAQLCELHYLLKSFFRLTKQTGFWTARHQGWRVPSSVFPLGLSTEQFTLDSFRLWIVLNHQSVK